MQQNPWAQTQAHMQSQAAFIYQNGQQLPQAAAIHPSVPVQVPAGEAQVDPVDHKHQMKISDFPEDIQGELRLMDANGDGIMDSSEILSAFHALKKEKETSALLTRALLLAIFFLLLLVGTMSGLTWVIVDQSRKTDVSPQGTLTNRETGQPVQVASSDLEVNTDGVLTTRGGTCAAGNSSCDRSTQPVLRTAPSISPMKLSSNLTDADLRTMKDLTFRTGPNWIHVHVQAVWRIENSTAAHGSVVVFLTTVGELTLDGEDMALDSQAHTAFTRAGVNVEHISRRGFAYTAAKYAYKACGWWQDCRRFRTELEVAVLQMFRDEFGWGVPQRCIDQYEASNGDKDALKWCVGSWIIWYLEAYL